jgi:hypothetical protein
LPVRPIRCNLQLLTMPTPSLILVPARFKTGKLYTPLATTSGGLVLGASGDFNVTRGTTATRVNANGLIESVASGIPRLDYYTSGGTAGCPALLVEPSAQNLALQSEAFNTTWSPTNITVSTNVTGTLSPAGGTTADKIIPTSGNLQHRVDQSITLTASGTYTFSVFAKADGYGFASLRIGSNGAAFNLSNGNTGAISAGITARADNYGGGWYRLSITGTSASGSVTFRINVESALQVAIDFAGDGTSGILLYGAQVETGSVATSYIPTTTAAVTRNADNISLSSAVSGCIGQTQGTLYAEFEIRSDTTTRRLFALSDGTQSNRVFLYYTSNALRAQIQATDISLGNPAAGYHKVAFAYQQSGVSGTLFASLDGGAVVSGTTAGTFPSVLNAVFIGKRESSTDDQQWNARIRSAAIYTSRLTNAELIALSTL